jgi:hypothetical protein
MGVVGTQLGRLVGQTFSAAEQAAGLAFAVINIDTTRGSTVLLDYIEGQVVPNGAADNAALNFPNLQVFQGVNFQAAIPLGQQLSIAGIETFFSSLPVLRSYRELHREFSQPLILEPGQRYSVFCQAVFDAAIVNNFFVGVNAQGRLVQPGGQPFPFTFR